MVAQRLPAAAKVRDRGARGRAAAGGGGEGVERGTTTRKMGRGLDVRMERGRMSRRRKVKLTRCGSLAITRAEMRRLN